VVAIDAGLLRRTSPEFAWRKCRGSGLEVALGKDQAWHAGSKGRWQAILCLEGAVWITQERDLVDHVLMAGEMFLVSQRRLVVVQALIPARIEVTPPLATAAPQGELSAGWSFP
jgi:hypothetical protein